MNIKPLSSAVAVSPQIQPADVPALAAAGYKAIICNRPDGEGADQPSFREIQLAAQAAGIPAHYQPVLPGQLSDEQATEFGRLLDALPQPVLAYCRSGMRSASLWGLSRWVGMAPAEILAVAGDQGYDLSALVRRMAAPRQGVAVVGASTR